MKSIETRLKNRFGKIMVMDNPPSPSSSIHRMGRSTSRRNSATHRTPQGGDEADNQGRLFWNSRRNSTVGGKDDRRSKVDLGQGGKKKPPSASPRQSAYTQTDLGRKRTTRKLNTRNTRCNSLPATALTSRDTIRNIPGNRRPEELTARCSASHEGRKLLQERLMVRVDALFNLLFSASPFLQGFHDRRKSTDLRMGGWVRNAAGQNERKVSLTMALQANVGPKSVKVTETQVMRECSEPGQLYSIDVQSIHAEIPYADAFVVLMHFCLKATVEEYTDFLVFGQIKFLKSVWAVVKAFIEKNTYAGLEEFCQSLYSALLIEIRKKQS
ncbi:protein Aster-B isoform X2 [Drosophila rhopaloa]|uniref:VASt domain-containing protein n=1 Tax=Drosophila rhopaloa TaxID=1041015 RepID=A0ABM5HRQ8_DRORH|nr:protein Aster-B isoform X2 [Drosophila rhopaloa]